MLEHTPSCGLGVDGEPVGLVLGESVVGFGFGPVEGVVGLGFEISVSQYVPV